MRRPGRKSPARTGPHAGAIGLLVCAAPFVAPAAERIELVRELLASHGHYRFVTEQTVVHDDAPTDGQPGTVQMETALIVEKAGREIFREDGWRWEISTPELPIGTDVTGDGTPDAVFTHYSGGAHCCAATYIFELRDPIMPIVVATGHSGAEFVKLEGKPGYAIVTADSIFAYWRSSFAASPFPKVVLTYRNGTYQPDMELTRKAPPAEAELEALASRIRSSRWTPPKLPDALLATTVDLIYGGNLPQALRFVDRAWNRMIPGQAEFVEALILCRMPRSEFWPIIAAMNRLEATRPHADCEKIDRDIH